MTRYVIRVNYPDGAVAWVRHASRTGHGPIVRFPSKRAAQRDLAFIREGLVPGAIAMVVPVAEGKAKEAR